MSNGTLQLKESERRKAREALDWIFDLTPKEIEQAMLSHMTRGGEDLGMKMVYEEGGIEACIFLWRALLHQLIHVSEKPLNRLRQTYVQKFFDATSPEDCAKSLAALLGTSEQFIYNARGGEEKADPRQEKLFKETT